MASAVALVMIPGPAIGQNPLVIEKLKEFDARAPQPSVNDIRAAVAATVEARSKATGTCLPGEIVVEETAPITGAAVILNGVVRNELRNGWSVYARHVGCEGKEPFRYAVIQLADGTLRAPLVNEGRSFANLSIMRDTSAGAALAALAAIKSADPNCAGTDMSMGPTKVESQSSDLGPEIFGVRYIGSWVELWQFRSCGRRAEVAVEFRADGDGGAYTSVKSDRTRLLETNSDGGDPR